MEGYIDSGTDEGLDGPTDFFLVFKETEKQWVLILSIDKHRHY